MLKHKAQHIPIRENLSGLQTSLKYAKTIFGEVTEGKVTFCFDTSGSMYRVFYHFREQLIEKLFQLMFGGKSQKFNVVLFNSSVHQCYPKHVQCSYENIISAVQWMNKPYYESKSNMLGGLIKSFEDEPDCVYLITDGFPSNDRQALINHLPHLTKGRPIRCIMTTNKVPPDDCPLDFLEDVAEITNGSVSVVSVQNYGAVEVIMPVYYASRPHGKRRLVHHDNYNKNDDEDNVKSHFTPIKECLKSMFTEKTLQGDPMEDIPLVVPFIMEDPLSGKKCPFYNPYFHWYWPQFWANNAPGPCCLWTTNDRQYHCMDADFRESRAFIAGREYLESYRDPSHVLPYAGMLIINKRVLACNHSDENNYYIGRILSQVCPSHFLIKFDFNEEYDDVQKTELSEIIDLDEQKRHSINTDDFVLAPTDSEKDAYKVALVIAGKENRSSKKTIIPVKNEQLTVKFLSNKTEKNIEHNKSIFLSPRLKQIVERCLNKMQTDMSQDSYANEDLSAEVSVAKSIESINRMKPIDYGTNNNCVDNKVHGIKAMEPCRICCNPYQHCCCINRLHHCIDGKAASPVDDGNALTLEQINEQINQNSRKIKDVSDSENKEEENDEDEEDEEEDESCKEFYSNSESDNELSSMKKRNVDEFTETDLNWCILHLLNKQSKQKESNTNKRPQWKYWGRKPIPDVIDPPSTEPYGDPPNWGCLMPKVAVEWPSTSFQEVDPHRITNQSPQKMYDLFKHQQHQSSQRPKRDASVGRDSLPAGEKTQKLLERRFNYLQGGYPKLEIRNPYSDSVKPLLSSCSSVGPLRNLKSTNYCLNLLEKSRIEGQIQRDESNILRYIETKPKIRQ